jgi:hypothetical protein
VKLAGMAYEAVGGRLAPPHFHDSRILEYLRDLAVELVLPLFLYNMLSHTRVFIDQTVQAAADISRSWV